MKNRITLTLIAFLLAVPLVSGCQKSSSTCVTLSDTNAVVATPQTDKLAFPYASDYATKDYAEPESGLTYGKCGLVSVTDGDTANFTTVKGTFIKCRFLGINTPESTAKVEAWGVKASEWCKTTLLSATDFCLVNDIDVYGKLDSSGARNLSFVWYKTPGGSWRLYNLECVEEAYSKNLLFTNSTKLNYLDAFTAAGKAAVACGYRVNGTSDPDYTGSEKVIECTAYYVRHHFDEIGINYETGSSGYYLHVTGLVVGMIGDNMVIRDLNRDLAQDDTDALECIYCYAGYNSALASKTKVGYIASFYCRASKFPSGTTNIQLTDVNVNTYGTYKFVTYSPTNAHYIDYTGGATYGYDYDPVDGTSATIASSADLGAYFGLYAKFRVQIRNATYEKDDDGTTTQVNTYYKQTFNSQTGVLTATTIYAYIAGTTVPCNLRIDASSSPSLSYKDFAVDEVWEMKGYLASYYENYQIQTFNNVSTYKYATKIS
jgi:endonuclease YncB( thermonuclease family)